VSELPSLPCIIYSTSYGVISSSFSFDDFYSMQLNCYDVSGQS
jgi:hypothetical protein